MESFTACEQMRMSAARALPASARADPQTLNGRQLLTLHHLCRNKDILAFDLSSKAERAEKSQRIYTYLIAEYTNFGGLQCPDSR